MGSGMQAKELEGRRWTHREVILGILALIIVIVSGILVVIDVVGPWILVIPGPIAILVALMRYRAEAEARMGSRPGAR